ncbi:unnamed protein product [Schistocephalus solidus]|uniref:Uncharacterized protein n=1 Tax=Schistocephalus solidus TaxID=70667 RepID=A0A183ST38_SCHSO|nr:unnamed protein product [Schistocephalus solidus]
MRDSGVVYASTTCTSAPFPSSIPHPHPPPCSSPSLLFPAHSHPLFPPASPSPFLLPTRSKNSYGEGDSNHVDIAALNETRFFEQGQLEEVGAGYTFFWSGRPKAERRDASVSFAIRNDIVRNLPSTAGINNRLMSLHLPQQETSSPTSSAPTSPTPMTSSGEARNKSHED